MKKAYVALIDRNGVAKGLRNPVLRTLAWAIAGISLFGCAPQKTEIKTIAPQNLFDYSRTDLVGLLEFSNRFGTLPDSAKIALCREMDLFEKDGKIDARGLMLHQAAAQIFFSTCSASLALQQKLSALEETPELPAEQRQFAALTRQLIASNDLQKSALTLAQNRAKTRTTGTPGRRKTGSMDKDPNPAEEVAKPATPPLPDEIARRKLEALRNLEKSMDRNLPR